MMLLLPAVASGLPQLNTVHCCPALTLLKALPDQSVNCIVTSPPYFGLRSYVPDGDINKHHEIGLEETPAQFVAALMAVFREAKRVLRDDGTMWVNLGDSYASGEVGRHDSVQANNGRDWSGTKKGTIRQQSKIDSGLPAKNLLGIPWRVAFALQDDGWILRSDVIWSKPNPMPESVTDRPTKSHEYVFLFAKSARYWYDADAIREEAQDRPFAGNDAKVIDPNKTAWLDNRYAPGASGYGHNPAGRNKRTVWTIATDPTPLAHFATFPQKLIEPMILAGCPVGGVVLDPFFGSGTTGLVARRLGRNWIGCDLSPDYVNIARERLRKPDEPHYVTKTSAPLSDLPMFAAIEGESA